MIWDIACAALIKAQGEFGYWFTQFDHSEEGSLNEKEFIQALS